MKIAVIGSGISGLVAAYSLHERYDITVFEKNDYIGGHSRTVEVNGTPVDTGFIVFNDRNYPTLTKLFEHLGVAYEKSDMSFGAHIDDIDLEYSSSNVFAQIRNIWRPKFWGMLWDILKFNRVAPKWLDRNDLTLEQALDEMKAGAWFRRYYLQAMGAAIWSCSSDMILKFPASSFIRFFANHGLLTIFNQPQWFTVTGGSQEYIKKLTAPFKDKIKLNNAVTKIERKNDGVIVHTQNDTEEFDRVIFACHADQALSVIDQPSDTERDILGAFTYQDNQIIVHSDERFMPTRKKAWASWVYLKSSADKLALSYWMNNLQNLDPKQLIIETLNPPFRPAENLIYDEHNFRHPVFTKQAVNAQDEIKNIQGHDGLYYCGAWQKYGFHEDGALSAVTMLCAMSEDITWL